MKTQSAKKKGRKLQKYVESKISELIGIKAGKDELIQSREMGQSGVDVKLIGEAQEKYPFSIECKNVERWDVPGWIRQAQDNQKEGTDWQLFIKKNRSETYIVMSAEAWFDIYDQYFKQVWR